MSIPYHGSQYKGKGGHYESWFMRANHPTEAKAFWIRYTQFIPADNRAPLGEIWAIWFDGDADRVVAAKQEFPLASCSFSKNAMDVKLPTAELTSHQLRGSAEHGDHVLKWNLQYEGESKPILFLPESFYNAPLPKAKSVISRPQVRYNGTFEVDGESWQIDQWRGSENHNWGSKHTDQYAWGQVTAFDEHPEACFECITARVKLGPIYSPWLTIATLRLGEETLLFNTLGTAIKAKAGYQFFDWTLSTGRGDTRLEAHIQAPANHFTALTYYNPPSGSKTCLNSKIARCSLKLTRGGKSQTLDSAHGAAFEILTDSHDHGVPLSV